MASMWKVRRLFALFDTYRQKNYAPGNTQSDSAYTDRYLGQCQEMVKAFRSHSFCLVFGVSVTKVFMVQISNFAGIG